MAPFQVLYCGSLAARTGRVLNKCDGGKMQRVMVIGGSGSGKSTLARRLGKATGLPVVHIDPMYWKPGWVQRSKAETTALVLAATRADEWVFDGNHHSTFPARIARADHLVFLDMPTWLRVWRVVRRSWRYYGKTRPDMGVGCPERFDLHFIFNWVGGYRWRQRKTDLALMQNPPDHLTCVHLKSRAQVEAFIQKACKTG